MSSKMKNEQGKKAARRGADYTASRVRSSIAKKLNMRLFFRLIAVFLGLDVTILLITAVCLFVYSEQTALKAARTLLAYGVPEQSAAWEAYSAVTVREFEGEIVGLKPPEWMADKLPEPLARAARSAAVPDDIWKLTGPEKPVAYRLLLEHGGAKFEIAVSLGTFFRFFNPAMAALLIFQLIDLYHLSAFCLFHIENSLHYPFTKYLFLQHYHIKLKAKKKGNIFQRPFPMHFFSTSHR